LGKKTPGFFTFQVQAKFPGGPSAWQNYLATHLKADVPTRHKAPVGLYTVVVTFLVDKEGKIQEVEAANDPGYGTAEEAVRVIKKGPVWIPAEQNGKKVIYKQKQSITFQVSKE
jgi:protein TonB